MPWQDRLRVSLAFGLAAWVAAVIPSVVVALASADGPRAAVQYLAEVLSGDPALVIAVLTAIGLSGAVGGWTVAHRLGHPPGRRPGVVHPDMVRGMGAGFVGYPIGAVLVAVAGALAQPGGPSLEGLILAPFIALVGILMGSFTILPLVLLVGGVTGRLVGQRVAGTLAKEVGLETDTPP